MKRNGYGLKETTDEADISYRTKSREARQTQEEIIINNFLHYVQ